MTDNICDKLKKFYDSNEYYHHIMDKIKIIMTNVENLIELISLFDWDHLQNKLIANGFDINIIKGKEKNQLEIKDYITLSAAVYYDQKNIYVIKLNDDCKRKIQEIIKESLPIYSQSWNDIFTTLVNIPNKHVQAQMTRIECFHKSAFNIIHKWLSSKFSKLNNENENGIYRYISDWTKSYDIYNYFDHCDNILHDKNNDTLKLNTIKEEKSYLEKKYHNLSQEYDYKSILYWPNENENNLIWPIVISFQPNSLKYIQCKLIAICEINSESNIEDSLRNIHYNIFLQPINDSDNNDNDKIFNSNTLISFDIYLPISKFLNKLDKSIIRADFLNKIQYQLTKYLCVSSYKNFCYHKDDRYYDIHIDLKYIAHKNYYTNYILKIFPKFMVQNLIFIIIDYSIEY